MSEEDRYELFGGATETLAAEAVWIFKRENNDWPLWDEAVDFIAESDEVAGDRDEADRRLTQAISDGDVNVRSRLRGQEFGLEVTDEMAARLERRYMDRTMPRVEEDAC